MGPGCGLVCVLPLCWGNDAVLQQVQHQAAARSRCRVWHCCTMNGFKLVPELHACAPLLHRFWQELGWERARSYMRQLLGQAVALLTEAWGSSTLAPLAMCGTMACVQLPAALAAGSSGRGTADSADAKFVQVGGMAGWIVHALLYMDAPLLPTDVLMQPQGFTCCIMLPMLVITPAQQSASCQFQRGHS